MLNVERSARSSRSCLANIDPIADVRRGPASRPGGTDWDWAYLWSLFPPVFATNRPPDGETVAEAVNRLLAGSRENLATPPELALATAYLNPAGFALIAVPEFSIFDDGTIYGLGPQLAVFPPPVLPNLTRTQAIDKACEQHPELVAEYEKQR